MDGSPECALNNQLTQVVSAFVLRPPACTGTSCNTVFAAVFDVLPPVDALPADTLLYTCVFRIAEDSPLGEYEIGIDGLIAADLAGREVPSEGIPGKIIVESAPSPTATATATVPPTPTPIPCAGDCDGSDSVTVEEIITLVNIALGTQPPAICVAGDRNGDAAVTVDEILIAVNLALLGCP